MVQFIVETLEGLKNADEIVKVPGVHAIFAVSSDFGNFAGYKQGDPDYEREINIVHDAAIKAGVKLCCPWAWKDRPGFTCFQAGKRDGGHRPRRKDRAWRVCGYAG
jgi:2-keto-3-deoxy-L-rhamnonate aldolase RhmA